MHDIATYIFIYFQKNKNEQKKLSSTRIISYENWIWSHFILEIVFFLGT